MTVHGRITQGAVKPTTNDSSLYIPLKDERDHGVHEPESPEEGGGCEPLKHMAGPMSKQHRRSFYTHRRDPSGFLPSPLVSRPDTGISHVLKIRRSRAIKSITDHVGNRDA